MGSTENQSWRPELFDDPLAHVGLGLEERAEITAERTGLDLEVVLEQLHELDRHWSFDDPAERRQAESVVLCYEMNPIPRSRETAYASVAGALGVPLDEARRRIEEVEGLIGLSIEVPIHRAMIDLAVTLYELYADELPPPGDPRWGQGRKRRPSGG